MLGLSLLSQSGGEVTPEARDALAQAVRLNPEALAARFHLARGRAASGDREGGVNDLRTLARLLPAGDPRLVDIDTAIREATNSPPTVAVGPASEMINQMVAGLAQRLQSNPDDPEGWVRLVRSYAVLGDGPRRDAALEQARRRYGARPEVLEQLEKAAATEPMR
jgi:cytochrome c-type biogenesis protein CcmH